MEHVGGPEIASPGTPVTGMPGLSALEDPAHQARVARDKDFQYLLEDVAEFRRLRDSKQISLNEAERRKERDTQEARLKAREGTKLASLQDDGLQASERSLAADLPGLAPGPAAVPAASRAVPNSSAFRPSVPPRLARSPDRAPRSTGVSHVRFRLLAWGISCFFSVST